MLFVRMNGFVSIFVGYFKYYKQAIEENVDTLKSIPYSLKRISISVLSNFCVKRIPMALMLFWYKTRKTYVM